MTAISTLSVNRQKQIRKLQQKKFRVSSNTFIGEGFRLFEAAVQTDPERIREVIFSDEVVHTGPGQKALSLSRARQIPVFTVNNREMKGLSEETTPPGLLFTAEILSSTQKDLAGVTDPVVIYLDRISEPGNMGAIMRTAAWFGVRQVILSPDSVDPYNAKSVRASAGAIFNCRIFTNIDYDWFSQEFKARGYRFIATVVNGGTSLDTWQPAEKTVLLLGQEADGLSAEVIKTADEKVQIPGVNGVESLNLSVAAGIFLYDIFRKSTLAAPSS